MRRMLEPEGGGPRTRAILEALYGHDEVQRLIERGELVKYGDRKGAKWGLQPPRRSRHLRRNRPAR